MWSWFHFTVNDILLFQSWKIDTTWSKYEGIINTYKSDSLFSSIIC